jgi:hypothetical protein
MIDIIRVLQDEIEDLRRIIAANESVLDLERSIDKRGRLLHEISDLEDRIDRVKLKIEFYRGGD